MVLLSTPCSARVPIHMFIPEERSGGEHRHREDTSPSAGRPDTGGFHMLIFCVDGEQDVSKPARCFLQTK
ncbi:unnamed protein product [Haemonchus placei]|uniref:Uncharacterized protein n=1 Tax=Haemonchus placei TaxID=6290 RepID=A0A0N4VRY7_HAEPC|nr:unnamed protein product [Haemonchus placei]